MLAETEEKLADGRSSILGGDEINFTDIAFASIMGLWLQPKAYGAGKDETVRLERSRLPEQMLRDMEDWSDRYPLSTAFMERLYAERR